MIQLFIVLLVSCSGGNKKLADNKKDTEEQILHPQPYSANGYGLINHKLEKEGPNQVDTKAQPLKPLRPVERTKEASKETSTLQSTTVNLQSSSKNAETATAGVKPTSQAIGLTETPIESTTPGKAPESHLEAIEPKSPTQKADISSKITQSSEISDKGRENALKTPNSPKIRSKNSGKKRKRGRKLYFTSSSPAAKYSQRETSSLILKPSTTGLETSTELDPGIVRALTEAIPISTKSTVKHSYADAAKGSVQRSRATISLQEQNGNAVEKEIHHLPIENQNSNNQEIKKFKIQDMNLRKPHISEHIQQRAYRAKAYLKRILNDEELICQDESQFIEIVSGMMDWLYLKSLSKGKCFSEGTYVIKDYKGRIFDFLTRGHSTAYKRISSHFTDRSTEHHYGIDVEQGILPANEGHYKKHILFSKIALHNSSKAVLFIKPEKHGVKKLWDTGLHAIDYLTTRAYKLIWPEFYNKGNKERISQELQVLFDKLIEESTLQQSGKEDFIEINKLKEDCLHSMKDSSRIFGWSFIYEQWKKASERKDDPISNSKLLIEIEKEIEKHDHLDVRTGNEVIFDYDELLLEDVDHNCYYVEAA